MPRRARTQVHRGASAQLTSRIALSRMMPIDTPRSMRAEHD
jgi:hypothetical protein